MVLNDLPIATTNLKQTSLSALSSRVPVPGGPWQAGSGGLFNCTIQFAILGVLKVEHLKNPLIRICAFWLKHGGTIILPFTFRVDAAVTRQCSFPTWVRSSL